ncbi:MAG: metalloregulator ArsR/SmtB family transcription factor [Akkermansiaceae bacterium]
MKLKEASIALSALAQESRLEVFRLLAKNSPDGLCAGDLSKALDIPKPTMSFHLKELSTAGLIDSEKLGRSIKYRLQTKRMSQLMEFLSEDCCQGRPELCCPKGPNI